MTSTRDYGCNDLRCMTYRTGLAYRADVAEHAVRALQTQVARLRIELEQATRPPEPPDARYQEPNLWRWGLLGLILIVGGTGLIVADGFL